MGVDIKQSDTYLVSYALAMDPAATIAKNQNFKTPNHPFIPSTTTIWFFKKSNNKLSSALCISSPNPYDLLGTAKDHLHQFSQRFQQQNTRHYFSNPAGQS